MLCPANFIVQLQQSDERKNVTVVEKLHSVIKMYIIYHHFMGFLL